MSFDPTPFAVELLEARRTGELRRRSSRAISDLTVDEAYAVQTELVAMRVAEGERVVGYKVGCTSPAVRAQFGLDQPVCARLLHPHVHDNGHAFAADALVDPAIEAELVFRIGADLGAPDPSEDDVRAAIDGVAPGIEVHHYRFWHGEPTLQELIAGNAIHAAVVSGPFVPLGSADLAAEISTAVVNGEVRASQPGSEVLGSGPLRSIQWLASMLAARGERLRAGDLVLAGSAVPLIRVDAGDEVEARFSSFGSCHARLV